MSTAFTFCAGITVFERGWLSSNNILIQGSQHATLIDSGYCTHADQTVALVQQALAGRTLDDLINTHLHSDHCGGNAALQATFSHLRTHIPPGLAAHVAQWDATALSYAPTGQQCPPFRFDDLISPGQEIKLGDGLWQVHGAPGHDPHAVMLFEPRSRTLISGDALWERGFGVVFPELEGEQAFTEVAASLDVIAALKPSVVIPGHGQPFTHVTQSIAVARSRLENFATQPRKHAMYAAKVLVKFKLLELQRITLVHLWQWASTTPYFHLVHGRYFAELDFQAWLDVLAQDLERSGAATREGLTLVNG